MALSPTSSRGSSGGSSAAVGMLASAHVATTGNIALTGLQTIDGVALADGDRVLVWLQTATSEKGIYLARAGAWERAADALTYAAMANRVVAVDYGGTKQYSFLFVENSGGGPDAYFTPFASTYGLVNTTDLTNVNGSFGLSGYAFTGLGPSGYAWAFRNGFEVTWDTGATPADGSIDNQTTASYFDSTNGAAKFVRKGKTANGTVVTAVTPMAPAITSGALPTVALVSATGAQIALNRDARTVTPVTFNPTGAATATCLVQLSPDNVTYSTLVTKTFPVSVTLAGSIDEVSVIVPAGWYLKLTATNATLGTTTYY